MPREQQARKDLVQSFHMPDDYTTTTSFVTTDRVRRSPSPPSFSKSPQPASNYKVHVTTPSYDDDIARDHVITSL
ncbi:hypothetical protein GBAR_LOCUS15410 [Geodia barretti]|uniref:Uncharacterized protein n=1 Tax=Geodia barretti TaxID=519541 RepID=A0AA35SBC9_GEOBA|nr:hypothetical protein GBAR_LOCUS15410 [Geodia barretti]